MSITSIVMLFSCKWRGEYLKEYGFYSLGIMNNNPWYKNPAVTNLILIILMNLSNFVFDSREEVSSFYLFCFIYIWSSLSVHTSVTRIMSRREVDHIIETKFK